MTPTVTKIEPDFLPTSFATRESFHLDRFIPVVQEVAEANADLVNPAVTGVILENPRYRPTVHVLCTAFNVAGTDCKVYGHINPTEELPDDLSDPVGWKLLATLDAAGEDATASGLYAKYLLVFDLDAESDATVLVAMGCAV